MSGLLYYVELEGVMNLSYIIDQKDILEMTSHVVSHHAARNKLSPEELCDVLENVYVSFQKISKNSRALSYKDLVQKD
ncbi:MAG: hypothetical protein AAF621_08065 [Pseudomonadota bacterium]